MQLGLSRLKKTVLGALSALTDSAFFMGIVLIGGLGSSWYMVEAGTRLTTQSFGPWVTWTAAARADADPYTRAHFARLGALHLSSQVATTYIARTDSDGTRLHSSCDYLIEGRMPDSEWWSLTVFDESGRLISNPAHRHAFTSDTIAPNPDDSFLVVLSRDARPGNWLPTGGAGRLAVVLTVLDQNALTLPTTADTFSKTLPTVRRMPCR